MRVLFAVSSSENSKDDIVDVILNEYQREYKKIITCKRAFYYDAIVNEIRETRDSSNRYDLIIISEDLEKNVKDSYETQDELLYKRLDQITDEAYKDDGTGIPIILICGDRRSERDPMISKLFVLGIYNILMGRERTIQNVCSLIDRPRNKKQAKLLYNIVPKTLSYNSKSNTEVVSQRELVSILKFFNVNQNNTEKCVKAFSKLYNEYSPEQLQMIVSNLPIAVRIKLEDNSKEYAKIVKEKVRQTQELKKASTLQSRNLTEKTPGTSSNVIIPGQDKKKGIFKKLNGKN